MNIVLISFVGEVTAIHYMTSLANSLAKRNSTSTIKLFLPEYSAVDRYVYRRDVSLVKFPFPCSLSKAMLKVLDPFLYRHLLQEIDSTKPDIVHIPLEFRFPFPLIWALRRKYPIVTTVHEPEHHAGTFARLALLNPIQDRNCQLIIKLSDKVTVHGEKHKEYLVAQGVPSHKVHVIPHGVFSFFNQVGYGETEAIKDSVLFFGKIAPHYKGIEYLIQAGKLVEQVLPSVTIVIAGEGDFSKYERLVNGDSHFIVDNRFIPDEEVAGIFQQASLLVLPYTSGSQSGVIGIAGAFKKPVVATDVGHFPEMIEDGKTGFIVPPRDARALAEAITKLLTNDELRQEMGQNAYRAVREKFSWDEIALKAINVYKEAIQVRHT